MIALKELSGTAMATRPASDTHPAQELEDSARASDGIPIRAAAWPSFAEDEIAAAVRVLQSGKVNYWTGEEGRGFESEFAAFCGCRHAVAVANGTLALECALRAVGVGPGDEVITSSRTFIASASCSVMLGARPVIADVDRDSQNLTAETIRRVLTPRTRAIVAVHLAGWPCEMDEILELARGHRIPVIEDCAQAQGANYKGRPVGSLGDVAAFSFCQDKIMTTAGEGGMVTTNSEDLWKVVWSIKDHGKSYDAVFNRDHPPGFRWLHDSFGTNARMTEVQSAIGRVALAKVPGWIGLRRKFARILSDRLLPISALRIPEPPAYIDHAWYKFYAFVRPEALAPGWTRDRIVAAINAEGCACFTGSCSEIYLENAFPPGWRPAEPLPVARELGDTSLMFFVHPTQSEQDMHVVADGIEKVFSVAIR
jgi:dTDP-4-amino-4,6-dideoxygalactose transaminase